MSILKKVNFFFLQDENSGRLLSENGVNNYMLTGDTRFDRVYEITQERKKIEILHSYFHDKAVLLAGSTWPEDENILLQSLDGPDKNNILLIIAPHEVNEKRIQTLLTLLSKQYSPGEITRFSQAIKNSEAKVIVMDNIGLLSTAYQYASFAWIGGGFGKGIHNILEAAAFGKPTIFGPRYEKFKEAVDLVRLGGSFSVKDAREAKYIIDILLTDKNKLKDSSEKCSDYVKKHIGATNKIISHIEKL
jgi:3-deoxy-D-manno-octulosonic-acid transferase